MLKVPYLTEREIENDAELLLAEYADTAGVVVDREVPVAEIATYHLALELGFADLHAQFGIPRQFGESPDILGAIWFEKEIIAIDYSLDPERYPSMRGRYRFSVAHEIGHWRLHRPYVVPDPGQSALFDLPSAPTVVCRSGQTKKPIEWQADRYASCLLMPRRSVTREWQACLGRTGPLLLSDLDHDDEALRRAAALVRERGISEAAAVSDILLEHVAEPLA